MPPVVVGRESGVMDFNVGAGPLALRTGVVEQSDVVEHIIVVWSIRRIVSPPAIGGVYISYISYSCGKKSEAQFHLFRNTFEL